MRVKLIIKVIAFYLYLIFCGCGNEDGGSATNTPDTPGAPEGARDTTFQNPINSNGPDPWVIKDGDKYYYTHTMGNRLGIYTTEAVSDMVNINSTTVWTPPPNEAYSKDIWAPELHKIDGKWYFYFAADDGNDLNHRMYVLENANESPTSGNWKFKGKIATTTDKWAIDGTVFEYNGAHYFIWSGWKGDNDPGIQQLYIAKMTNPWTLEGDRTMISEPTYDWEKNGLVNEGPEILKNEDGDVFLIYSGSGCWTDDYKLGLITLKKGGDPLKPEDWTKNATPVFTKKPENHAYGPGHNSFFKSPDETEDWIIYHANPEPGQGCGSNRSTRIQKFTWNGDGTPYFGEPVNINTDITKPSGEN